MPLATVAIPFDISDKIGTDYDARRTKAWVTTNAETIIDTDGNLIRVGSGTATVAADGTGTFNVWVPGTGSNPEEWQTIFHFSVPDRNAPGGRLLLDFGPYTVTVAANLADLVEEQEVPPTYLSTVTDLLDGYVDSASAAATAAAASATSAAASAELAAEAAVSLSFGYFDHGNVSGALEVDPSIGTHVLAATGPLTLTIADADDGVITTVLVASGAADVDIVAVPDAVMTDMSFGTFVRVRGVWLLATVSGVSGAFEVTPDTPTMDDTANTYTIPSTTGVRYEVGGIAKAPGDHAVGNVNATVIVVAEALDGYVLSDPADHGRVDWTWTFNFTYATTWTTHLHDTFAGTTGAAIVGRTPDTVGTGTYTWLRTDGSASTTTIDANRFKMVSSGGSQVVTVGATPAPAAATPAGVRITFTYSHATAAFRCWLFYLSTFYGSVQSIKYSIAGGVLSATGTGGTDGPACQLTAASGKSLTGHPTTGEMQVEVIGTSVKVYIDGVHIANGALPGTLREQQCYFDLTNNSTAYVDSYKLETGA